MVTVVVAFSQGSKPDLVVAGGAFYPRRQAPHMRDAVNCPCVVLNCNGTQH